MYLFKRNKSSQGTYKEKGAPEKHGLFLFIGICLSKSFRLVLINITLFILTLPMLFYAYLAFNGYMAALIGEGFGDLLPGVGFYACAYAALMSGLPAWLGLSLLLASVLLYGPAKMGQAYVLGHFARQSHVWRADFFRAAVRNYRHGLFFGVSDALVVCLLLSYILSGWASSYVAVNALLTLGRAFAWAFLAVYFIVRPYFYLLSVRTELKLRDIFRIAWMLSMGRPARSLGASLVSAALWLLSLFTIPLVTVVALPLVLYSLCGFLQAFARAPVIEKYVLKRESSD